MKTIYVKYYSPSEIGMPSSLSKEDEIAWCFHAFEFTSEAPALDLYANTSCTWSTLLDDDADVSAFINEAYEHIKANDLDWLEANFT